MSEPRIQYARTSDGVSIAYWALGEGTPLILTPYHRYSNIELEWQHPPIRAMYQLLASRLKLVRYDRRGTGLSQRKIELSAETEFKDLQAVIGATVASPFVLFGRGAAGPAAVRYAARNNGQVTHLILYDTVGSTEEWKDDAWLLATNALLGALLDNDFESLVRLKSSFYMVQTDPTWFASFIRASTNAEHLRLWLDYVNDATALLPDVRCATLVIDERWPGERPSRAFRLASQIPNAEVLIIDRWVGDPWPDMADVTSPVYEFLHLPAPEVDEPSLGRPQLATVLFTDLVGHTEMMSRLGDERGRAVLREHERITREVLKAHGGTEVKTMGDGFMASFGSVTRAVECAVALQRSFEARNREHGTGNKAPPEPLQVRVGLNAGEPIEEEGDLFGATVILASRIAAKAEGGEILVADTVRGLCSGKGFLFSDRGEFVAKGFEEPVRVYEVRWRDA